VSSIDAATHLASRVMTASRIFRQILAKNSTVVLAPSWTALVITKLLLASVLLPKVRAGLPSARAPSAAVVQLRSMIEPGEKAINAAVSSLRRAGT
jgi:hypothetical protein